MPCLSGARPGLLEEACSQPRSTAHGACSYSMQVRPGAAASSIGHPSTIRRLEALRRACSGLSGPWSEEGNTAWCRSSSRLSVSTSPPPGS